MVLVYLLLLKGICLFTPTVTFIFYIVLIINISSGNIILAICDKFIALHTST